MSCRGRQGMTRSAASNAESSLSAILSGSRLLSSAGVTSTLPSREFFSPRSISRSNDLPSPTSSSLNQTVVSRDFSRPCNSVAGPFRSSQGWHRNKSRRYLLSWLNVS